MHPAPRTFLARLTAAAIFTLLCSAILAAEPLRTPWEPRDVPHGSIEQVWYPSPTLQMKQRRMVVYLPPGYHENRSRKYPVLYLLHGGGGNEDQWVKQGNAADILDNEIAEGSAVPMIVVMPNGNSEEHPAPPDMARYALHAPQLPEPYEGVFAESLVKDVIPFVERTYRVHTSSDHRAISGLSMGGAQTVLITANNPGLFAYIGVFSAGGMVGEPEFDAQLEALASAKPKLYWTGAGDDDIARLRTARLYEGAKAKGLPAEYKQIPGTHTWPLWREFFVDFSVRLFK